jgi:hypothetical protein
MEAARPLPEKLAPAPHENNSEIIEFKYRILGNLEDRVEYITLTDRLIQKMVGSKTDTAIYLDKSARPVAWLVNELWDTLAPRDKDGNILKKPDTKFLNIDREQWGAIIGRSEELGGINVDRLPKERLAELRELYAPISGEGNPGDVSLLTNRNVMVVDEVSVSGDTLTMSNSILNLAFPDAAKIEGAYWMYGHVTTDPRSGVRKNTKLPVWYSDRQNTGRGVADRDTGKSARSKSSRQRIGKYWLSTTFHDGQDPDGTALRNEVKQTGADLREHKILYKPASGWGDDELDARMLRINGITTEYYAALIKMSKDDKAEQSRIFAEQFERQKKIARTKELGQIAT